MVHEVPRYNWSTARNFCNDNGANLASIHSFEETDFILSLVSLTSSRDYWIGLSSMGLGSSRTWSDQSSLDFLYWDENNPVTGMDGINSCVTFNKQRGYWQNQHCRQFLNVVCKRKLNSTSEQPISQPTLFLPGNCEKGWYASGNHCYKAFGERWSQKVEWGEAKDNCESIGATLASVHTNEEQDFLTDMLLALNSDAWIGLQSVDRGTTYEWSDDTQLDYANWDENEPAYSSDAFPRGDEYTDYFLPSSIPSNTCVKMTSKTENTGKWKEVGCSYKNSYICKKPKSKFIKDWADTRFCPDAMKGGWRKNASCYQVVEEEKTWEDAEELCTQNYGGHLVTIPDFPTDIFVNYILGKETAKTVWIGIQTREKFQQQWSSGWYVFYEKWADGERPHDFAGGLCVARNFEGIWTTQACNRVLPFICEYSTDKPPVLERTTDGISCPEAPADWRDLGGDYCYFLDYNYAANWYEANFYCMRKGGTLAVLNSHEEARILQNFVKFMMSTVYYKHHALFIGLYRQIQHDEEFVWVDGQVRNYTSWGASEPNSEKEQCVQVRSYDMTWNDISCKDRRGYICSALKASSQKTNEKRTNETATYPTEVCSGYSVGVLAAVVVCVLIVSCLMGVIVFYFCFGSGRYVRMKKKSSATQMAEKRPRYRSEMVVSDDGTYADMI